MMTEQFRNTIGFPVGDYIEEQMYLLHLYSRIQIEKTPDKLCFSVISGYRPEVLFQGIDVRSTTYGSYYDIVVEPIGQ